MRCADLYHAECVVPGCGRYARKLIGVHGEANLRHHMELLGHMAQPLSRDVQDIAKALLLDALKWCAVMLRELNCGALLLRDARQVSSGSLLSLQGS